MERSHQSRNVTRSRIRIIVALAIAVSIGLGVEVRARHGDRLRADWAGDHVALIATSDLDPGHILLGDDIREVRLPTILAPDRRLVSAVGLTTSRWVGAGTILTSLDTVDHAQSGPPAGFRWMSLPTEASTTPELHPGDLVDVLAVDPFQTGAEVVAEAVTVVAADDGALTIEVSIAQTTQLAAHLLTGVIVAVRR